MEELGTQRTKKRKKKEKIYGNSTVIDAKYYYYLNETLPRNFFSLIARAIEHMELKIRRLKKIRGLKEKEMLELDEIES